MKLKKRIQTYSIFFFRCLDDGRLTDGQGRTVDFANTLLIMTSNLGADHLVNQKDGEDIENVREDVMTAVRAHFRPEFLNRLDEILLFRRLGRDVMKGIVDIQLRRLNKLLEDRGIALKVDDKAKAWLALEGYNPAYGARPLKRTIQTHLQNKMAEMMLNGEIPDYSTVLVSANDDGLRFGVKKGEEVQKNKDNKDRSVA